MRRIFLTAIVAIVLTGAAYCGDLTSAERLTAAEQEFKEAFEDLRTSLDLSVPKLDESLVDGSRKWSSKMRMSGRFQHGSAPENIYRGSTRGHEALRAWYRSEGHRRLLLSPTIKTFGIGNDGTYWTFRAKRELRDVKPVYKTNDRFFNRIR